MGILNDILIILGIREPSPQQIIYAPEPSLALIPAHANNEFITEEGASDFKPLTKEFIEQCYNEMLAWAGYEEGKGKQLQEILPDLEKYPATALNWNFDPDTNPFTRMIDDKFLALTDAKPTEGNLFHIFGNALAGLSYFSRANEMLSEDRQQVMDFLIEDRVDSLKQIKKYPEFDPQNDPCFHYMTARVGLGCLDKYTELMLGKTLAAEIVRESERQMSTDLPELH